MSKVTLADVGSLIDATTAATTINNNNAAIVAAVDNTLSRDGTSPNTMASTIDMNGNRIVNLPLPITVDEPVRLVDLNTFSGGGTLVFDPLPSGGTTNQILKKNSNTNYDVSWASPTVVTGNFVTNAADITALKAVDTTTFQWANLAAAGRIGQFAWTLGNFTTQIAADTNNGIYVKANAIAASTGAWVRVFDFQTYKSRWFGTVNDYTTDNTTLINNIIIVANLINTSAIAAQQSAVYIDIEGGVKFSSANVNFLNSSSNVFVYLRFFANSDNTKGVANGAGFTNEQLTISVNSGYPGDATGGLVAENRLEAPLHPAFIANVAKQITGADSHLGTGQTRIPSNTLPARASYNIFDENVIRWRAVYEGYGGPLNASGVSLQPFNATVGLANVGSTGWPTIPGAGTIVTGVTSGAKLYITSSNTTSIQGIWITGTFLPGEKVTDGVTTSTNSITGGGVTFTNSTYPSLVFGTNDPSLTYGTFPNQTSTAFTVAGRTTLAPTNSGAATNLKETVTNPALLFTSTVAAVPAAGKQIVLNSANRLVTVPGVANGTGSGATGLIGGISSHGKFSNGVGVSTNAFNIGSISRTTTGVYAIQFTNSLANADYSISITKSNNADNNQTVTGIGTTGFTINNYNGSLALTDLSGIIYFSTIGGQ